VVKKRVIQKKVVKKNNMKLKKKQKELIYRHCYSFVKTFLTVFLAFYLAGISENGKKLFDLAFIGFCAKWSVISVLRNLYKLLTEK